MATDNCRCCVRSPFWWWMPSPPPLLVSLSRWSLGTVSAFRSTVVDIPFFSNLINAFCKGDQTNIANTVLQVFAEFASEPSSQLAPAMAGRWWQWSNSKSKRGYNSISSGRRSSSFGSSNNKWWRNNGNIVNNKQGNWKGTARIVGAATVVFLGSTAGRWGEMATVRGKDEDYQSNKKGCDCENHDHSK